MLISYTSFKKKIKEKEINSKKEKAPLFFFLFLRFLKGINLEF